MGVVQGFLFGAFYLSSVRYRSRANFYLAALILIFSYNNLQYFLDSADIISTKQLYNYFYIPVASLLPVLIYNYVRKLIPKGKKRRYNYKILYFPFLIFFAVATSYKIGKALGFGGSQYYTFFKAISDFQAIFSVLFVGILLFRSYHIVHIFSLKNKKEAHGERLIDTRWLKYTLILLFILFIVWTVLVILFLINNDYRSYFYIVWIGISIAIYWLGHVGVYKNLIIKERKKIKSYERDRQFTITEPKGESKHIISLQNYLVNEKRFLDSSLTLEKVAEELLLSTGHLSRIINTELGTNFSSYLNNLRVEEAKAYLLNPDFSKYTLAAIGLEAGFNSKSTFHTAFKKATGQTPLQFKKEHLS